MTGNQLDGGTYDNTYFVFVDAAGHSTIFTNNPRDLASDRFDLLRERTIARLVKVAASHRCAVARLWHWAGDGGLLVVHDERESVAVATALEVARCLVGMELSHLRDEFRSFGIQGELRLRVSVHKGPMQYRGPGHEGIMHSPAINLAAHLERATPPDTVAISADVHRIAGPEAERFDLVGRFEGVDVYVHAPDGSSAARRWLATHGMAGGAQVLAHHERPSQHEKARLVDAAQVEIVEMGSALHTCANYLVTRERPARYQQAVLDFLERGGAYKCVLVDPSSQAVELIGRLVGEIEVESRRSSKIRMFGVASSPRPPPLMPTPLKLSTTASAGQHATAVHLKRHRAETMSETSTETTETSELDDETARVVRLAVVSEPSRPAEPTAVQRMWAFFEPSGRRVARRPAWSWTGSRARTTTGARYSGSGRARAGSSMAVQ